MPRSYDTPWQQKAEARNNIYMARSAGLWLAGWWGRSCLSTTQWRAERGGGEGESKHVYSQTAMRRAIQRVGLEHPFKYRKNSARNYNQDRRGPVERGPTFVFCY